MLDDRRGGKRKESKTNTNKVDNRKENNNRSKESVCEKRKEKWLNTFFLWVDCLITCVPSDTVT